MYMCECYVTDPKYWCYTIQIYEVWQQDLISEKWCFVYDANIYRSEVFMLHCKVWLWKLYRPNIWEIMFCPTSDAWMLHFRLEVWKLYLISEKWFYIPKIWCSDATLHIWSIDIPLQIWGMKEMRHICEMMLYQRSDVFKIHYRSEAFM